MIDESATKTDHPYRCSLCGVWDDLEMSRLECVTKTTWRSKATWKTLWSDQDRKSLTEYSAPRVWSLALCRPCRVKSYLRALKRNIKVWGGTIIFLLLVIFFWASDIWSIWHGESLGTARRDPWLLLFGFLLVIFLPVAIWSFIVNIWRLACSKDLQEVPAKRTAEAFMNAGETILEHLQTSQGGTVYGEFRLPDLPEDPVPRDIPKKFELASEKPKQERLVREIKDT
jgi:hypothetical protein